MRKPIIMYFFLIALLLVGGSVFAVEATAVVSTAEERGHFFTFSEGAAASWMTRIIRQTDRSNFVFRDFLLGMYLRTELRNAKNFTPTARLAVYYPLSSTFNNFPQPPKNPLHIGVDLTAGLKLEFLDFPLLRLNGAPAFHMFYMTSDRWNYLNLGAAVLAELEVPLFERWTLLFNGTFSFDSGNLGGNRVMEPFDIVYQYQLDIGIRYSKRFINQTSLF